MCRFTKLRSFLLRESNMSRETYCPSLVNRIAGIRNQPFYSDEARKQWDHVSAEIRKDCDRMQVLDFTKSALEQSEDRQLEYVELLKYANEVASEVAEAEAMIASAGGAARRAKRSAKKATRSAKKSTRKSVKRVAKRSTKKAVRKVRKSAKKSTRKH